CWQPWDGELRKKRGEVLLGIRLFRNSRDFSVRAVSREHCPWSPQKNFQVQPERPGPGILQVQANHIVKLRAAASLHLPQSGDPWLDLQHPAAVPNVIRFELVLDRWTRAYQ